MNGLVGMVGQEPKMPAFQPLASSDALGTSGAWCAGSLCQAGNTIAFTTDDELWASNEGNLERPLEQSPVHRENLCAMEFCSLGTSGLFSATALIYLLEARDLACCQPLCVGGVISTSPDIPTIPPVRAPPLHTVLPSCS